MFAEAAYFVPQCHDVDQTSIRAISLVITLLKRAIQPFDRLEQIYAPQRRYRRALSPSGVTFLGSFFFLDLGRRAAGALLVDATGAFSAIATRGDTVRDT